MYSTDVSEKYEDNKIKCCNYLIFDNNEITPCNNLTTCINIAKNTKSLCTIFESISTKGHYWQYMCDISHEVLNG